VGEGGAGGEDDSARSLPICPRAVTLALDGPLVQETQGLVDSAVAGDWNRDGKLDLAGANEDGSVSVLFGFGDGSFDSSAVYQSGLETLLTQPESSLTREAQTSIASSDLNGDGWLDLVVGNRSASYLAVLLGTANGSFSVGATDATEGGPSAIALADFDGDGTTDIAVAAHTGAVSVLLGKGNGKFGSKIVTSIGGTLKSIASADLNHDGRMDVVTVGDVELSVLLGDGAGSFVKTQTHPSSLTVNSIEIADFDADGHADLAFGATCSPSFYQDTQIGILLGNGDGTFVASVNYPTGPNCFEHIAVADVNKDGAADVVTSPVSALLGEGDGTFLPVRLSSKAVSGNLLGLGDWNGDGKLDVASASDHWVTVFLGEGDGRFGANEVYAAEYAPHSLALVDIDRNGTLDLITAGTHEYHGGAGGSAVSVQLGVGDGTYRQAIDYDTSLGAQETTTVDLNGDGWLDLITLGRAPSSSDPLTSVGVRLGIGNADFTKELVSKVGQSVSAFATGDLNGDGYPDIVAANGDAPTINLLVGKGDGSFFLDSTLALPASARGVAVLEANGDGKQDIGLTLDNGTVGIFLGIGGGIFAPCRQYRMGDTEFGITAADLNQDGNVDIVTWGPDSVSTLFGAGNGSFNRRRSYEASAVGRLVVVDVDQNGTPDLVMTSAPGGLSILLGARDATFLCATRYAPGSYLSGLGVGDANGDGRLDVAAGSPAGVDVFLNVSP